MITKPSIFFFAVFLGLCFNSHLMAEDPPSSLLSLAPSWTSIAEGESEKLAALQKALQPLLILPPDKLRANIAIFLKSSSSENQVDAWGKVFVLHRLYFNIPSEVAMSENRFFGGWGCVPVSEGKVDVLWPVHTSSDGQLVIVGYFCGYMGKDYDALDEFDFLSKKYGRRPSK